jgi:hypothetical protein
MAAHGIHALIFTAAVMIVMAALLKHEKASEKRAEGPRMSTTSKYKNKFRRP